MPKTIILAIFTLCLSVAALVTDLVSPYAGGVDSASASRVQTMTQTPARAPLRAPSRGPVLQASTSAGLPAI